MPGSRWATSCENHGKRAWKAFWGTPGRYRPKNMLLALVEELGHEYKDLLDDATMTSRSDDHLLLLKAGTRQIKGARPSLIDLGFMRDLQTWRKTMTRIPMLNLEEVQNNINTRINNLLPLEERNKAMLYLQDPHDTYPHTAPKRIYQLVGPYFLGKPYFSEAAAQAILVIPLEAVTLKDKFDELLRTKVSRNQGDVCAAHEVEPLLLNAFGWSKDQVTETKLELQKIRNCSKKEGSSTMHTPKHKFSKFTMKD